MNARHALVAVAVAGLLLGGGSVALATPGETGPGSRACDRATGAHLAAKKTHHFAEKAADKFKRDAEGGKGATGQLPDDLTGVSQAEQARLDSLNGTVARLKGELDKAAKEREEKCADPKPDPEPQPEPDPKPVADDDDDKDGPVFVIERRIERQVEVVPNTSDGVETGGL